MKHFDDAEHRSVWQDWPWWLFWIALGLFMVWVFLNDPEYHGAPQRAQAEYVKWCHDHDGIIPPKRSECQLPRAYPPETQR